MPRATDGPRRERVLVLLDALEPRAPHPRAHDPALSAYIDAIVGALDAELVVACSPHDADHYRALAPRAVIEPGPAALRWRGIRMLWRQFALPRIARVHDIDAVHSPRPPVPLMLARPRVVTVHNMNDFDRAASGRRGGAARRAATRIAVRAADEVVTLQPFVALALERHLRFAAREVLVSPPIDDPDRFAETHRLAYRAAASLVPAETGPIQLPSAVDDERLESEPDEARPPH